MERLVTDWLTWHMEVNHLFNRFQSGYRKLRSSQDHIARLQDDNQRAIHAKYSLCGVFVDLENAFDLMWTDGLLHKLQQHNIIGQMFNCIPVFLTDRHIRIRVGAELSDLFLVDNGSPQGSVSSPVLFIIMMNTSRSQRRTSNFPTKRMTAPSEELDQTRKSTDDTSNPTSTG